MADDNQTQLAREAAREIYNAHASQPGDNHSIADAVINSITAIILRKLNGSEQRGLCPTHGEVDPAHRCRNYDGIHAGGYGAAPRSEQSEYRRGVEDSLRAVEGQRRIADDNKPHEYNQGWTHAVAYIERRVRALLTTEQGVSGRGESRPVHACGDPDCIVPHPAPHKRPPR